MQVDQSYMQPLSNSSLEYQIRLAFFTHFRTAEDIQQYLVNVGRTLVNERDKITQLFKRVQHSFAELFFHSRLLYQECKDLEILKDFFKTRLAFLKQQVSAANKERDEFERVCKIERDLKE